MGTTALLTFVAQVRVEPITGHAIGHKNIFKTIVVQWGVNETPV